MMLDNRRTVDVFFYGLFMDEALLRLKQVEPRNRRIGVVENFRLVIGERATLTPSFGHKAHGVLFALTHDEVDTLYSDQSVAAYRPEAVTVHLADSSALPALCFNLPVPPLNSDRNLQYAAKLKALAESIGLPPTYVSSLGEI